MRLLPFVAAAAMLALLPTPPAEATPEGFAFCAADAPDMRALRGCSTMAEDIALCQDQRAGQGIEGPIRCLEDIVAQWTAAMRAADTALERNGTPEGWTPTDAFLRGRTELCRDPEEIRLSTERYGPGHAGFEAARCELQQTIRRAIDSVAHRRGFR